ncbi:MAG: hypothetical protein HY554_02940 [Elusimicrobia bacterium]|nr:hypothetical protein [Elusimicrobiota bacterium]
MNLLYRLFPDAGRYAMVEATYPRLTLAAGTCLVVGFFIYFGHRDAKDWGDKLFGNVFLLQALALLVYGTSRATHSVIAERSDKTWELQRLTPQSAFDLAMGKLLGAPIYAYFIAAALMPWAVVGALGSTEISLGRFLSFYATLGAGAFFALSTGLLASAYADKTVGGSTAASAGALLGFMALQLAFALWTLLERSGLRIPFCGLDLPTWAFLQGSLAAFGAWAFAGAKWRIGRDLLEERALWRLPAFLAFLVGYQLGFAPTAPYTVMIAPAFFCYFAAVLHSEPLDHWKNWLVTGEDARILNRIPTWLSAWLAYAALAALVALLGLGSRSPSSYPLMQTAFLGRDLAFLQWCRFTKSRNPEILALVFIGLAYGLPLVTVGPLMGGRYAQVVALFLPVPARDGNLAVNVVPGALQAAAAFWALLVALRARLRS